MKTNKIRGNLTVTGVWNALEDNGFGETPIYCPDGTLVWVTPCSSVEISSIEDCEYFLCEGDLPYMGNSKLDKLVDSLNRHAELVAEAEAEKIKLRKFFERHEQDGWDDDSWSWYSDWHKDVYGFRPHGRVCGVYVSPY